MKTYSWQESVDLDVEGVARFMCELSDRYDMENPYALRSLATDAACAWVNASDVDVNKITCMPDEVMDKFFEDVIACYQEMSK